MPDYQLSKVYQIVCLTTGQKYVGSTTQKTLAERLAGHIYSFKRWKDGNGHFVTSFTIIEQGSYQIELLEACPCNSKDELNAKEGYYIRMIDCVNKKIEGRTIKEWYEDNAEYNTKYREDNKTAIAEQRKKYREINKTELADINKAYREAHKNELAEKDKVYYEANKQLIAEKAKAFRETNKEALSKRRKELYQLKKNENAP